MNNKLVIISIVASMLLVSCTKKEQETIVSIVETPTQQNTEVLPTSDNISTTGAMAGGETIWTEEEMKEMGMMDGEHSSGSMMMDDENLMTKEEHEAKVASGEWTEEEMKMMEDMEMMDEEHEGEAMMEEDSMMGEVGVYTDYDVALLGKTENTILFFHANWCPSCRAADENILKETVPANLTILKTDYDSNTDLKKKYKVLSQHTFVQVDSSGELIKKWVGGNSITDLVENLK